VIVAVQVAAVLGVGGPSSLFVSSFLKAHDHYTVIWNYLSFARAVAVMWLLKRWGTSRGC
jgi:hypothetical protein